MIIHSVFTVGIFAIASIREETFKTQILIYLWPVNTISAQKETLPLPIRSISKTSPTAKWIFRLPTISGFSPNKSVIHPNFAYPISLHNYSFKIL